MSNNFEQARPLHIIFPKQTRLKDAFEPIAEAAGLMITRNKKRHAFGTCQDITGQINPFEASIKKPGVMFRKLIEGRADMAIIGLDKYIEEYCRAKDAGENIQTRISATFNCAACGMYVAAAIDNEINSAQDLKGLKIATSYPYSLKYWLKSKGIEEFEIIECDGDTEDEIRDGSADAIFEIVDSGQSLRDNDLERKIKAYDVHATLIEHAALQNGDNSLIADQVRARLIKAADELRGNSQSEPKEKAPSRTDYADFLIPKVA